MNIFGDNATIQKNTGLSSAAQCRIGVCISKGNKTHGFWAYAPIRVTKTSICNYN